MKFMERFDIHFSNMQMFGASVILATIFQAICIMIGLFPITGFLTFMPVHAMLTHTFLSVLYSVVKADKRIVYFRKRAGR